MSALEAPPGPSACVLDLYEGITTPTSGGCPRWPSALWLRATDGARVRGRCRATNQCGYCARFAARENAELLALDALVSGQAPRVWIVLTTPETNPEPKAYARDREKVTRALRRRFPDLEAAWLFEMTTGTSEQSGGERHPHWNGLLKGVGPEDVPTIRAIVEKVWCSRQGANPAAQHVGLVDEVGGLMRYLALHFQKVDQSPPEGWRGHRFTHTRASKARPDGGYLCGSTPELREQARAAIRGRRLVHLAGTLGLVGEEAEWFVAAAAADAAATEWELVRESPVPASYDGAGWPAGWGTVDVPIGPIASAPSPDAPPADVPSVSAMAADAFLLDLVRA